MAITAAPTTGIPAIDFAPLPPPVHHEPLQIADDVFLIRQLDGEGIRPLGVYCNSLVIAGKEPVIVDTGGINNRAQWLEDVFSIVDPEAIRWLFISHDDSDHLGNIEAVFESCPNITLVFDWLNLQRTAHQYQLPLRRMRWVNSGDHFSAGGRTLVALRPPTYDAPSTRGLFDTKSRTYWSSDSFGALVPHHIDHASDLPLDDFRSGLGGFNRLMAPWVSVADERKFADSVQAVRILEPSCIATAHGPVIGRGQLDVAYAVMERLPGMAAMPMPDQEQLEAMIAASTHGSASAQ